jgi:hypothetical protein
MRAIGWVFGLAVSFGTGSAFAQVAQVAQDARPIEVESAEAKVAVEIEPASATLLQRDRVAATQHGGLVVGGFQELCSGRCRLKLNEGTYTLALSLDEGDVTPTKRVSIPAGDSRLTARYESHSGKRLGGWLLIGTSPVTWWGSGLLIKAIRGGKPINGGEVALISGIAVAQLVYGIVLVATGSNELSFDIVPLPAAPASLGLQREVAQEPRRLNGLGLQFAF